MAEQTKQINGKKQETGIVQYQSRDGQQIKLSFDAVRKYLVSGKPEFVKDAEIMVYMGTCKARGLNPFKRDCYLVKYSEKDPAATIVSIDYYRGRAKAQNDCAGWTAGIIIRKGDVEEWREGSFFKSDEGEELRGGWFRARPRGWDIDRNWSVQLAPYVKKTADGKPTRFWSEENQPQMICKVAESQGLRMVWPDEFGGLYIPEEIIETESTDTVETAKMPKPIDDTTDKKEPLP